MAEIAARELRNNVSAILRRVEAGEHLRVTVSGRPVAELVPLPRRPERLSWEDFIKDAHDWQADADLTSELRELLSETTDEPAPQ